MGQMLSEALTRLENVCADAPSRKEALERLRYPERTVAVSIPLRRDDGSLLPVKAWRCQYSRLRGPGKGGIRFHPDVTMDEAMTLGFWMTIKTAIADLPFGGAKGGAAIDAHTLSAHELEKLSRAYIRSFSEIIGPDRDIPAPDVATGGSPIAWMADEYFALTGKTVPAVITGKPVALFGSKGRTEATGKGAAICLDVLSDRLPFDIDGARCAVQGFGNAGRQIARELTDRGAIIVAISDSSACLIDEDGLDVEAVAAHKDEKGSLDGFEKAEAADRDEIVGLDCDLFVPAALGGVIKKKNADTFKGKAILEVANGPVLPEADDALRDNGVVVIPDVLANAGGVIVSYFEWLQNRSGDYWSEADVTERLKDRISASAKAVCDLADDDTGLRDAAYALAVDRLAETVSALGDKSRYRKTRSE